MKKGILKDKVSHFLSQMHVTSLLVALSGGSDSVALLCSAVECLGANNVFACHVNHGIRGDEALRDEKFCSALCESLNVGFSVYSYDIPSLAEKEGLGMEECARKYRYEALTEQAKKLNLSYIATAHNALDRAEGVIFKLCRGSGLRGVSGIPKTREIGDITVIRPMLDASKDEILEYLASKNRKYVTDSTNLSTDYTRNYIRAEIIPKLKKINNGYLENIASFCELASQSDAYFSSLADEFLKNQRWEGDTLYIDTSSLKALKPPLQTYVICRSCEKLTGESLPFDLANDVIKLAFEAEPGSQLQLPFGCDAFSCGTCLALCPRRAKLPYSKKLVEGLNDFSEYGFLLYYSPVINGNFGIHYENIYKSFKCTILNADIIKCDVFARSRAENDRYSVNGINRKIKNLLNSKHITHDRRIYYPIICDADGIVCVPGNASADGYDGRNSERRRIVAYIPTNKTDKEVFSFEKP